MNINESIAVKFYRFLFKDYRIVIHDKNPPAPFNCIHEGEWIETALTFRTYEQAFRYCQFMNARVAKDNVRFSAVLYSPWFVHVYDELEYYVRCAKEFATTSDIEAMEELHAQRKWAKEWAEKRRQELAEQKP